VGHRRSLVASAAVVLAALVPLPAAGAAPAPGEAASVASDDMVSAVPAKGIRHLTAPSNQLTAQAAGQPAPPTPAPVVGDERIWAALDQEKGTDYAKDYTLRGVGAHIEVWVASDEDDVSSGLAFPGDDCRNDERIEISDEQIQHLMREYDGKILPAESEVFSVAPERDGTNAALPEELGLPADYYRGEGDNVVVLVDNVRDANFYDPSLRNGNVTYVAGFFYATFNEYFDRNVMTIDAYDWLHRTGDNPPNEPVPGDVCASKPARPNAYESTFAHEYQHLLQYYEDPAETEWVNEGLSMYAEDVTGYAHADLPVTDIRFDPYIQCLLGHAATQTSANPNPRPGGPENSLTVWEDQGEGSELLCDYGAAFSFMLYLEGRYGRGLLSALHRDDRQGLDSLATLLRLRNIPESVPTLLQQWQVMLAIDAPLAAPWTWFPGNDAAYSTPKLNGTINWDNADAYSTPGAPPNGGDYVRVRDGAGRYVGARGLRTIEFDGASTLPPTPVAWTVAANPPDRAGDAALYSGTGSNLDRAAIRSVTVPAADPTLTFESRWETEPGWDFGFVQVSTDAGRTWTSLANDSTTTEHDPGAIAPVVANLPGFTGSSEGWTTQRFDLSRWAGREVLLSFRLITDPAIELPGWWVDDIQVGGQPINDGSTVEGFRSATELNPIAVSGFTVQLVGYPSSGRGPVIVWPIGVNNDFDARLTVPPALRIAGVDVVAVIVTYNEPTEQLRQYAPYALRVNGVLQPGGGPAEPGRAPQAGGD
jgi:hypothetical protein